MSAQIEGSDGLADVTATKAEPVERGPRHWLRLGILGLTGLFYAYAVWNAIATLISYATAPLGLNVYGWFVLLFATVFPIFAFVVAAIIGRRRGVGEHTLVMITGLAVVAVFRMDIVAYMVNNLASLVA